MKIVELNDRSDDLIEQLVLVWESSVRAAHFFLNEEDISSLKNYVPLAIKNVPILLVAETNGKLIGFMGIVDNKLEMLFIAAAKRGQEIGKQMVLYGFDKYSVNEVAVNEQNPLARKFYERMGFAVYKRTALDKQGNPYPLLYMKK